VESGIGKALNKGFACILGRQRIASQLMDFFKSRRKLSSWGGAGLGRLGRRPVRDPDGARGLRARSWVLSSRGASLAGGGDGPRQAGAEAR